MIVIDIYKEVFNFDIENELLLFFRKRLNVVLDDLNVVVKKFEEFRRCIDLID